MTDYAKTCSQIKLNKNTKSLRVCRDKKIITDSAESCLVIVELTKKLKSLIGVIRKQM